MGAVTALDLNKGTSYVALGFEFGDIVLFDFHTAKQIYHIRADASLPANRPQSAHEQTRIAHLGFVSDGVSFISADIKVVDFIACYG